MAFEYGSIDLAPFRIEGIFRAACGALILVLGLISLFVCRVKLSRAIREPPHR